jgi:hypothetical protein
LLIRLQVPGQVEQFQIGSIYSSSKRDQKDALFENDPTDRKKVMAELGA